MNIFDLITGSTGNQVAEQATNKFGVSKNQVFALLAVATPLIISYLRNKSQNTTEAEALNNALDRDHDGSILNNPLQAEQREQEGGAILNHIFGDQKTAVENQLSQNTGISMGKLVPLLSMLAPIIMGYIGKQKQETNTNAGGLGDLLGNILGNSAPQQVNNNPIGDILSQVLGGGNTQQESNPLNDLIGNILGGGANNNQKQGGGIADILGSFLK